MAIGFVKMKRSCVLRATSYIRTDYTDSHNLKLSAVVEFNFSFSGTQTRTRNFMLFVR